MGWQPGQSGNPAGRPPGDQTRVKDLAKSKTDIAINTLAQICENGESESARVAAAEALLNRGWGKPTQPVSGDDEMPPLQVQKIERVLIGADAKD